MQSPCISRHSLRQSAHLPGYREWRKSISQPFYRNAEALQRASHIDKERMVPLSLAEHLRISWWSGMNDPLTPHHHMSNPDHRLCIIRLLYHIFMLLFSARPSRLGFLESSYLMMDVSLSSIWCLGDQDLILYVQLSTAQGNLISTDYILRFGIPLSDTVSRYLNLLSIRSPPATLMTMPSNTYQTCLKTMDSQPYP